MEPQVPPTERNHRSARLTGDLIGRGAGEARCGRRSGARDHDGDLSSQARYARPRFAQDGLSEVLSCESFRA